jgi:hypothetical protein
MEHFKSNGLGCARSSPSYATPVVEEHVTKEATLARTRQAAELPPAPELPPELAEQQYIAAAVDLATGVFMSLTTWTAGTVTAFNTAKNLRTLLLVVIFLLGALYMVLPEVTTWLGWGAETYTANSNFMIMASAAVRENGHSGTVSVHSPAGRFEYRIVMDIDSEQTARTQPPETTGGPGEAIIACDLVGARNFNRAQVVSLYNFVGRHIAARTQSHGILIQDVEDYVGTKLDLDRSGTFDQYEVYLGLFGLISPKYWHSGLPALLWKIDVK